MKPRTVEHCKTVLRKLRELPVSALFRRPVSDSDFPNYSKIISNPMDLSKIRKNLKHGKYKSLADLERDLEQISKNSAKANGPAHPVTACARTMLAHYRKFKKQYFPVTSIDQLTEDYCALCVKLDAVLSEHPPLPQLEIFTPVKEEAPARTNAELLTALSRFTSREQQLQLLFLLREFEPRFEGQNDITVNLAQLKPETIAKLNDFVNAQREYPKFTSRNGQSARKNPSRFMRRVILDSNRCRLFRTRHATHTVNDSHFRRPRRRHLVFECLHPYESCCSDRLPWRRF
jgi:hypothetical protein